jgi:hypothetical protein
VGYLQSLLDNGLLYNTICGHRSAISRYHRGLNGIKIGDHKRISEFIQGAFNKNPPQRVLVPNWDLSVVLQVLQEPPFEPLEGLDLKLLTFKTVFLVAITSARRVSEIQALGRFSPFARFEKENVCLNTIPGFLSKTANPSHLGQDIILPSFCKESQALCVKCVLEHYIKVTGSLISPTTQRLFVAFGGASKGKPVCSQTIAGWLVRTIRMAYEIKELPPPEVKAHSTRSAATSWGLFSKASLQQIVAAADWRQSSTFIRHYQLNVWKANRAAFGLSVLQSAEQSS